MESNEILVGPGDTVIFYTDGVTEAMNEDYDEFGEERLHLTARTHKKTKTPPLSWMLSLPPSTTTLGNGTI
ncbi:MAG: SpoIIE family protein phosphatase [Chloroflexi bacterium]|nr:SpoIIE family protein phosphatase [Chloroflexota bacterium]